MPSVTSSLGMSTTPFNIVHQADQSRWFIFAFLMLLCTLKSTLAFFSLFFFLDITFLLLSIAHFVQNEDGSANLPMIRAAGILGLITAFISWWNAMAGMLDSSNSFFVVPVRPPSEPGQKSYMILRC